MSPGYPKSRWFKSEQI